jgi:hypothetical protein
VEPAPSARLEMGSGYLSPRFLKQPYWTNSS